MHVATTELIGISPYSQSRYHEEPKLEKEAHNDYEMRTWRKRLHVDGTGHVYIPNMAFQYTLSSAAAFLRQTIPGGKGSTYTKHFVSGVLVAQPLVLPVKADDVFGEPLFLNPDGRRGGGTRVPKTMPRIEEWKGEVVWHILDDVIVEDVFRYTLEQAGQFIGIGRFRPQKGGFYGRFAVEKCVWREA